MDFIEKLLDLIGYSRPEEPPAEEVGTTQPSLYSEEQRRLSEEFGDTELLADIYNAQRTMENPQVELGARYMDRYRSEVPGGLATLMFQPSDITHLGSAIPAGSVYNTLGNNYHQIQLKSLEDLEELGFRPERRDKTIFHELGHIGEFITDDLIEAGVIPPSIAGDYNMISRVGGLGEGITPHTAIHTMDDHYGRNQKYDKIPRTILEPKEFDKEKVDKELAKLRKSRTVDDIQAEINAEMKRIGKGNWNSRLDELVAERDRAKASPTGSIENTQEDLDAMARNIVMSEVNKSSLSRKSPEEQILDAIFDKELEDRMVSGHGRHYLGKLARDAKEYEKAIEEEDSEKAETYRSDRNIADFLSEKYGFDVTDFSPENVEKMVDQMKRHTLTANKLAEMIMEDYPWGYIKEKVTYGY